MKLLHVASFNGNIGDIANHNGFYKSFRRYIRDDISITPLEMREFYRSWALRRFDAAFAELANRHDLIVWGGGNFLAPIFMDSATGTTIDITADVLGAIRTPMLFNGLGVTTDAKIPAIARERLGLFLEAITRNERCLVSVRNDGSFDSLANDYGKTLMRSVIKVPDGGYFVEPQAHEHISLAADGIPIAIALGGDQLHRRFPGSEGFLAPSDFSQRMGLFCNRFITDDPRRHLVFVPHIAADFCLINQVLEKMDDKLLRRNVSVAPLVNGTITPGLKALDIYRHCSLIVGMRHHANVCGIALNRPTLGLVNITYHKVDFDELGLPHRYVWANQPGFEDDLYAKATAALKAPEVLYAENVAVLASLEQKNEHYFNRMRSWLAKCGA